MKAPSRRAALLLPLLVPLAVACSPDFGPLSEYQDAWEGELRFEDQAPRSLAAEILFTRALLDANPEHRDDQKVGFADLSIDGVRLAARLRANHVDWKPNAEKRSATAGREFIQADLAATARPIDGAAEVSPASEAYGARHQALLASLGLGALPQLTTRPEHRFLSLWGERRGDVIEGTVVVHFPDAPRAARDTVKGSFRLTRTGPARATHLNDQEIETDAFLFRTARNSHAAGAGYATEIRAK